LLPIINNIGGIGQNRPNDVAVRELKDLVTSPSQHRLTESVVFKQEEALNAKAIAEKTNVLSPDQVCVSVGELSDDPNFVDKGDGTLITYTGRGSKTTKLSVMCDAGNALSEDLGSYSLDQGWVSACSACTGGTQTCCLVAIRKA